MAGALRGAPSELGSAFPPAGRSDERAGARTFLTRIEEALTDVEVGEGDAAVRWPAISRSLDRPAAARLRNWFGRPGYTGCTAQEVAWPAQRP